MKKVLFMPMLLLFVTASYSQILNDNELEYEVTRYLPCGSKWNKSNLTYYICNAASSLTPQQQATIIQTAFQRWAEVTNLTFTQVSSFSRADIRLRWDNRESRLNKALAYTSVPHPNGGTYASGIHFDDLVTWVEEGSDTPGYVLLHVAMHEIGHALGLNHSTKACSVMYPYYTGQTTLDIGDILGIGALYGFKPIHGGKSFCLDVDNTYTSPYPQGTYTWRHSSNITLSSKSGNKATFTANADGVGWIALTIGSFEVTRRNFWIGTIAVDSISSPTHTPSGQYVTYYAHIPTNATPTGYQWILTPQLNNNLYGANSNVVDIEFNTVGNYQLVCRAYNSCGWGAYTTIDVNVYNRRYYALPYPNPASNELTVSFNPELLAKTIQFLQSSGSTQRAFSLNIKLLDLYGVVKHQATSFGEDITIDVSGLSNGMYVLQVYDGIASAPETHKVVVK